MHPPTRRAVGGVRPRNKNIQALRAIAVALVVIYHGFPSRLPGGFTGVDIFFVISGYLITQQLVDRAESGFRGLGAFYARRLRRIVPAGALVLMVTLLLTRIALGPLGVPTLSSDGRAVALFFPNIHFATQGTDYLTDVQPSPLLHYWSLGVEEQFYLLWPALVIGMTVLASRRRGAVVILALVTGTSFAASAVLTPRSPSWAFFGLHTRAWEFGIGGLLWFAAPWLRVRLRPVTAGALAVAGLAAIAAAGIVLGPAVAFPGWVALLPVSGAALVIAGSLVPSRGPDWILGRAPLQRVGDASYSLYLWHWPLIVLFGTVSRPRRVALIALAVVFAFVTYRLIEEPFRRARWLSQPKTRSFALAAALIAAGAGVSSAVGVLPRLDAGIPVGPSGPAGPAPAFVPSNLRPQLSEARLDLPAPFQDGCVVPFPAETSPTCAYGPPGASRTVVLFGDSHAGQWAGPLTTLAVSRGWRLVVLTKANCPPAHIRVLLTVYRRTYTECGAWRAWALGRISELEPALVVVSGARSYGYPGIPRVEFRVGQARGLEETLAALARETRVLLIADTPQFSFSPPVCLAQHLRNLSRCGASADIVLERSYTVAERRAAAAAVASFVDFNGTICPRGTCDPIHGNLLLYADENHLTRTFTDALEPDLATAVDRALAASPRQSTDGRPVAGSDKTRRPDTGDRR